MALGQSITMVSVFFLVVLLILRAIVLRSQQLEREILEEEGYNSAERVIKSLGSIDVETLKRYRNATFDDEGSDPYIKGWIEAFDDEIEFLTSENTINELA